MVLSRNIFKTEINKHYTITLNYRSDAIINLSTAVKSYNCLIWYGLLFTLDLCIWERSETNNTCPNSNLKILLALYSNTTFESFSLCCLLLTDHEHNPTLYNNTLQYRRLKFILLNLKIQKNGHSYNEMSCV